MAEDDACFKAPGGLVIPLVAIVAIFWLLTSLGKWEIFSTLAFIVTIILFFYITKWFKRREELIEIAGKAAVSNSIPSTEA